MAPLSGLKDREFQGRKIYSIQTAPDQDPDGKKGQRIRSISLDRGRVCCFSTDNAILEEFLRGNEKKEKGLKDIAGLNEASQKIGGMNTGFFSYENQVEGLRNIVEAAKVDPTVLDRMIANPIGPKVSLPEGKGLQEWFDVFIAAEL